jgi:hypothetical protein
MGILKDIFEAPKNPRGRVRDANGKLKNNCGDFLRKPDK